MARISPNPLVIMLVGLCIAILQFSTGQAQQLGILPFPPLPSSIEKCKSSLSSVPGCISEIFGAVRSGQIIKIGPACCDAINQVSDNCWRKLLPFHPSFPPLLKKFCAAPSPSPKAIEAVSVSSSKFLWLAPIGSWKPKNEYLKCWLPLLRVKDCAYQVYESFLKGKVGKIGSACCEAVSKLKEECLYKIFSSKPSFPPLLKASCTVVNITTSSAPKGVETSKLF